MRLLLSWRLMKNSEREAAARVRSELAGDCVLLERRLVALLRARTRIAPEVRLIRKLGKSLRGGLELLGMAEDAGRGIQGIGRLLGGDRDAVSRSETWRCLAWDDDGGAAAAIAGLLDQQRLAADRPPPPEAVAWCLGRSREARAALLAALEPEARPLKQLKRLHRRMVKHCRLMERRRETDFHEARKALKAWLGAARLLPELSSGIAAKVERLSGILGRENDLAVLEHWLDDHGFTKQLVPGLWETTAAARRRLQDRAIRKAAALLKT